MTLRFFHTLRVLRASVVPTAIAWLAICAVAVMFTIGCGRVGPERVVVTGRVTYQGESLPNGEFRFVPIIKGTPGPVSGGLIVEGAYTADGLGGVPIGTYRVEIRAFRADKDAEPDPFEGNLPRKQYLPEKYNTKTELEITIEPGSGKITRNFELEK